MSDVCIAQATSHVLKYISVYQEGQDLSQVYEGGNELGSFNFNSCPTGMPWSDGDGLEDTW